jgi:hypothetical protein
MSARVHMHARNPTSESSDLEPEARQLVASARTAEGAIEHGQRGHHLRPIGPLPEGPIFGRDRLFVTVCRARRFTLQPSALQLS